MGKGKKNKQKSALAQEEDLDTILDEFQAQDQERMAREQTQKDENQNDEENKEDEEDEDDEGDASDQGDEDDPENLDPNADDLFDKIAEEGEQMRKQSRRSGGDKAEKGMGCCGKLMIAGLVAILVGAIALKFGDERIEGLDRGPNSVDHYKVLKLSRTATTAEVKKTFKKLALKWHPDKQAVCEEECQRRFAEINEAYRVLSAPEFREAYDQVEVSYEALPSVAAELTSQNFDSLVLQSDDIWVVQVYSEWHRSCIRFAAAWEETVGEYDEFVNFGRIHFKREEPYVRKLPTVYALVPSTLIYAGGKFQQAQAFIGSGDQGMQLLEFMAQSIPSRITTLTPKNPAAIAEFLNSVGREEARCVIFPDSNLNHVSQLKWLLRVRALARTHRGGVKIAVVSEPDLKFNSALLVKNVAQRVIGMEKVTKETLKFPLMVVAQADSAGNFNVNCMRKDKLKSSALQATFTQIHQSIIPEMSAGAFSNMCLTKGRQGPQGPRAGPRVCVAAVGCQQQQQQDAVALLILMDTLRSTVCTKSAQGVAVQCLRINTNQEPSLSPLCGSDQTDKVVVISNGRIARFSNTEGVAGVAGVVAGVAALLQHVLQGEPHQDLQVLQDLQALPVLTIDHSLDDVFTITIGGYSLAVTSTVAWTLAVAIAGSGLLASRVPGLGGLALVGLMASGLFVGFWETLAPLLRKYL